MFHAIRDLTADAYGGWRAITLLLGGGGLHAQRMVAMKHYDLDLARDLARDAAGLEGSTPSWHSTAPGGAMERQDLLRLAVEERGPARPLP